MYSNFITPPDIVESVLIINATQEQLEACSTACEKSPKAYNVYFYNVSMNNPQWLNQVRQIVDAILMDETNPVEYLADNALTKHFGPDKDLKQPADYFAK